MAGGAHPARAMARPFGVGLRDRAGSFAGLAAAVARAPRPIIFAAVETAEAEAVIVEQDGAVRIAFAGGDRIAEPGDEQVADQDLRAHPLRQAAGRNDVHARHARSPVAHAQLYFLLAADRDLLRRPVAVVERPRAARVRRRGSLQHDGDAMVSRRQVRLALPVALALFEQPAAAVEAQPLDHVARPAATVACLGQPRLRLEYAVAAMDGDMAFEISFRAKQPEAVLDLPCDAQLAAGRRLGGSRTIEPAAEQHGGAGQTQEDTHGHPQSREVRGFSTRDAAKM